MTSILVLLACLAVALAAEQPSRALVDSMVIEKPYEFDFNKWAIQKSLEDSLVKINHLLFDRLAKVKDPAENIRAAKEILREASAEPRLISEQVFRKSLRTFTALERTEGQCNWSSYVILAENYVASENHMRRAMGRVYSVMDYYHKRHARKCRPYYREKFRQLLEQIDREDLRRVQLCFSELNEISDISIIVRGEFELTKEILGRIAERIVFLMKENSEWQQILELADQPTTRTTTKKSRPPMVNMIEKYLIGPCENYHNHFRGILVPARLDAAVEDDEQWQFLTEDDVFTTGLKDYLICNSLLRNGAKNHYINVMNDAIDKLRGVR